MDERQRFKLGFITRCIEEGFTTPAEICQRAKTAADRIGAVAQQMEKGGEWGTPLWEAFKGLGTLAATGAVVGPPILGGAAGYGLARASDIDEEDIEEAREREIIEELKRQSAKIRRQQRQRPRGTAKDTAATSLF
jgi:hypothetical protein